MRPQVLRVFPEFITTTQEDAVNPFLTTIIIDGVVIAKGAFSNKKSSRQVRLRARRRRPPGRSSPSRGDICRQRW